MWGRYKRQQDPINGEGGEKQVQGACLLNAKWSSQVLGYSVLPALPVAGDSAFFTYLYNQGLLCIYNLTTNLLFLHDYLTLMDNPLTVPCFLYCLFPIQHHTATWIICLQCKFDPVIPLLQTGFSPTVSQIYVGFQDPRWPASSLPFQYSVVTLPLSSVLTGHRTGMLSTLVSFTCYSLCLEFYPPRPFHQWYCLPKESLRHSVRSASSSWKPSLASWTEMSSPTFEPPL